MSSWNRTAICQSCFTINRNSDPKRKGKLYVTPQNVYWWLYIQVHEPNKPKIYKMHNAWKGYLSQMQAAKAQISLGISTAQKGPLLSSYQTAGPNCSKPSMFLVVDVGIHITQFRRYTDIFLTVKMWKATHILSKNYQHIWCLCE